MQEIVVACTFRDESECEGCNLNSYLGCRYSKRDFCFFTLNQKKKAYETAGYNRTFS